MEERAMKVEIPVYDFEKAVKFIVEKSGVDSDTVIKVLDAEEGYMRSIGIIEDVEYMPENI